VSVLVLQIFSLSLSLIRILRFSSSKTCENFFWMFFTLALWIQWLGIHIEIIFFSWFIFRLSPIIIRVRLKRHKSAGWLESSVEDFYDALIWLFKNKFFSFKIRLASSVHWQMMNNLINFRVVCKLCACKNICEEL
jgi:hypothetical protein